MKDLMQTVTFNVKSENREMSMTFAHPESAAWTTLLEEFVDFLHGMGYVGVRERISVEDGAFCDGWTGLVHDSTDEDWK